MRSNAACTRVRHNHSCIQSMLRSARGFLEESTLYNTRASVISLSKPVPVIAMRVRIRLLHASEISSFIFFSRFAFRQISGEDNVHRANSNT